VQTSSDPSGAFRLAPVDARPGDELVAEGPLHTPLRRPLPAAGELEVALVSRKRALLDRLVSWARHKGKPYDVGPEPTPGHVRRASSDAFPVARWADAVERAAYGGQPVDKSAEAEVDRLAPSAAGAPRAPAKESTGQEPGRELGREPGGGARSEDEGPRFPGQR
jgi:hypothetical protein